MEPAIGASTWALGSQRCRPYRGIFTIKAIMHANHRSALDQESIRGWFQYCIIKKFREPVVFWIYTSAIKRGRDPDSV